MSLESPETPRATWVSLGPNPLFLMFSLALKRECLMGACIDQIFENINQKIINDKWTRNLCWPRVTGMKTKEVCLMF